MGSRGRRRIAAPVRGRRLEPGPTRPQGQAAASRTAMARARASSAWRSASSAGVVDRGGVELGPQRVELAGRPPPRNAHRLRLDLVDRRHPATGPVRPGRGRAPLAFTTATSQIHRPRVRLQRTTCRPCRPARPVPASGRPGLVERPEAAVARSWAATTSASLPSSWSVSSPTRTRSAVRLARIRRRARRRRARRGRRRPGGHEDGGRGRHGGEGAPHQ